jgi:hypothetical protein
MYEIWRRRTVTCAITLRDVDCDSVVVTQSGALVCNKKQNIDIGTKIVKVLVMAPGYWASAEKKDD